MCSVIQLIGDNKMAIARTMDFNLKMVGAKEGILKGGQTYTMWTEFKIKPTWDIFCTYNASPVIGLDCVQEAINAAGLSFSLLYNVDNTMATTGAHESMVWPVKMLAQYSTVAQVRKEINDIVKAGTRFRGPMGYDATIHFYFCDVSGDGITIEFHDGAPTVYDNHLGVMTNGPEFSWHLTNLRNYLNVSPNGVEKLTFPPAGAKAQQEVYKKTGHGNGFLGVPGGNGSPDRFIRLCLNKFYAMEHLTAGNVEARAAHLIGLGHTLQGTQNDANGKGIDYTLWTSLKTWDGKTATMKIKRVDELDWKPVTEIYKDGG